MTDSEDAFEEYLDVDDGCGCAEIRDPMSERRREDGLATPDEAAADDWSATARSPSEPPWKPRASAR